MVITDGGGERIQEFHGQQQEVPGPIMTKEGLVAAIAELTAAQDAAAAKKDFLGAEHYRVQILQ